MDITWEYFCNELMGFREIMGSLDYTIEQWDNAWKGLLTVYMHVPQEYAEAAAAAISALQIEYDMRVQYRLGLR